VKKYSDVKNFPDLPSRMKTVKAVLEKPLLHKYEAFGMAYKEKGVVLVEPNQPVKEHLDSLLHEAIHILCPKWPEWFVCKLSRRLSSLLWRLNYRRIYSNHAKTIKNYKPIIPKKT
jgi:hypothetical protein